jgi:Mn-dependent DtxR family transcriptional regulator
MDPGERLAERSIAPAIRKLVELGLAEWPQGPRQGVHLTIEGLRLARKIAS